MQSLGSKVQSLHLSTVNNTNDQLEVLTSYYTESFLVFVFDFMSRYSVPKVSKFSDFLFLIQQK